MSSNRLVSGGVETPEIGRIKIKMKTGFYCPATEQICEHDGCVGVHCCLLDDVMINKRVRNGEVIAFQTRTKRNESIEALLIRLVNAFVAENPDCVLEAHCGEVAYASLREIAGRCYDNPIGETFRLHATTVISNPVVSAKGIVIVEKSQ